MGLIRTWVVVSALWIIGMGFLILPSKFQSLPDLPDEEMIEKSIELATVYSGERMPEDKVPYYEEALRRGLLLKIEPMQGGGDAFQVKLKDQTTITNVPKTLEAKEIARRINNHFKEKRGKAIKSAIIENIGILFAPPIALFVLGAAVLWASLGFRKST